MKTLEKLLQVKEMTIQQESTSSSKKQNKLFLTFHKEQ